MRIFKYKSDYNSSYNNRLCYVDETGYKWDSPGKTSNTPKTLEAVLSNRRFKEITFQKYYEKVTK